MNILPLVIAGVAALFVVMALYSRKQGPKPADTRKPPRQLLAENDSAPSVGSEAAPSEKLSPAKAREWLDDFLVQQQKEKK